MGFLARNARHNAIASGFQGQRQLDGLPAQRRFPRKRFSTRPSTGNGIRAPYIVATENDCLNGASMLFGHLLTNTAQIFADVRTYWSADSVKRVSGHVTGRRSGGRHFASHQFRPRPRSMEPASRKIDGQPAMKPFLGNFQG